MKKFLLLPWALFLSACQIEQSDSGRCSPTPQERSSWTQASRSNTADAYRKYLADYPKGCFTQVAARQLKKPVAKVVVAGVKPVQARARSLYSPY